jgi:hypothetical protein
VIFKLSLIVTGEYRVSRGKKQGGEKDWENGKGKRFEFKPTLIFFENVAENNVPVAAHPRHPLDNSHPRIKWRTNGEYKGE